MKLFCIFGLRHLVRSLAHLLQHVFGGASYPGGVIAIASSGTEIASLALSSADTKSKNDNDKPAAAAIPTALEIGDDGYLYVSTSTSLMRIQSRIGPAVIGTDMVIPAKKKN